MDPQAELNTLRKGLGERRPTDWVNRVHEGGSHQRRRLSKKKDLDLMACFKQSIAVEEREGCFRGVIGTPSALNQDIAHNSSSLTLNPD
jgi:hypothetical protein